MGGARFTSCICAFDSLLWNRLKVLGYSVMLARGLEKFAAHGPDNCRCQDREIAVDRIVIGQMHRPDQDRYEEQEKQDAERPANLANGEEEEKSERHVHRRHRTDAAAKTVRSARVPRDKLLLNIDDHHGIDFVRFGQIGHLIGIMRISDQGLEEAGADRCQQRRQQDAVDRP